MPQKLTEARLRVMSRFKRDYLVSGTAKRRSILDLPRLKNRLPIAPVGPTSGVLTSS